MATANDSTTANTSDVCSICLGSFTESNLDLLTTSCHHKFHLQCLAKSIQAQNNECPLCRSDLKSIVDILKGPSNTASQAPIQTVPPSSLLQPPPVSIASRVDNVGRLRIRPALNRIFGRSYHAPPIQVYAPSAATAGNSLSSHNTMESTSRSSQEDLVDEKAVQELADRIQAARSKSVNTNTEIPLITVNTVLEFSAQESTKESNIYGLVTLNAPPALPDSLDEKELDQLHVPVDIICVVDTSGSMRGEKVALLRNTLNYLVDQMHSLDRVAILSFDTTAYDITGGLKLMTDENKQYFHNVIDRIEASGGTAIGQGLQLAIQLLTSRSTMNPLGAILLLTDGQDNHVQDYGPLLRTIPEGISCHTYGYGHNHNAKLLSEIAERGHNGTFTYIDQPDSISPAFATTLGGLLTCIAKSIQVEINFIDDYKVTHSHTTYKHEPKDLPTRQLTFAMNDLNADERRNLVFQIRVPKLDPSRVQNDTENHIGYASVKYIDPNSQRTIQTPSVPFILERPSQLDPRSPLLQTNYTLDIQRNRAETSNILQRAAETPDYAHARALIDAQLAKIRASLSANDPLCQQLIQDLEHRHRDQQEFATVMSNMYRQHQQERATYSTPGVSSGATYESSGQKRYKLKLKK